MKQRKDEISKTQSDSLPDSHSTGAASVTLPAKASASSMNQSSDEEDLEVETASEASSSCQEVHASADSGLDSDSEVEFVSARVCGPKKKSPKKKSPKKSPEKKSPKKKVVVPPPAAPAAVVPQAPSTPTKGDSAVVRTYMDWSLGVVVRLHASGALSPAVMRPGPRSFQLATWSDGTEMETEPTSRQRQPMHCQK